MGYDNVGKVWTPAQFTTYLDTLPTLTWAKVVTLHHCGEPSLKQRPAGFTPQHLKNLHDFYAKQKKWSAGPHLFVDDDQLWGMSPFTERGVHSVGFNNRGIGIEVLGDYDVEDPKSGRGLACWRTAAAATKALLAKLGLAATKDTVVFHREDGVTNKTCPGTKITKDWVLGLIAEVGAGGAPAPAPAPTPAVVPEIVFDDNAATEKPQIDVTIAEADWQFIAGRWCVGIRAYLLAKGKTGAEIQAKLTGNNTDGFQWGTELIEGAYYNAAKQTTFAPGHELKEIMG